MEGLESHRGELADGRTLQMVGLARLCRLNVLPWSEPFTDLLLVPVPPRARCLQAQCSLGVLHRLPVGWGPEQGLWTAGPCLT